MCEAKLFKSLQLQQVAANPHQQLVGKHLAWHAKQSNTTIAVAVLLVPFPFPDRDDQLPLPVPQNIYLYNRDDIGAITQDLADFRDLFLDTDPVANSVKTSGTRLYT